MVTLQIPFSRWDWPNSEAETKTDKDNNNNHNVGNQLNNHENPSNYNYQHDFLNHRSDINCSHPKSNPIAASLTSLSAMLLEGQAVLAHQTNTAIWLFIGLNNGSIWKWTICMVPDAHGKVPFY